MVVVQVHVQVCLSVYVRACMHACLCVCVCVCVCVCDVQVDELDQEEYEAMDPVNRARADTTGKRGITTLTVVSNIEGIQMNS